MRGDGEAIYKYNAGMVGSALAPLYENGQYSLLIVGYQGQSIQRGGGKNEFVRLRNEASFPPEMNAGYRKIRPFFSNLRGYFVRNILVQEQRQH